MRVVFMGTPDFAVPILEQLCKYHEVAAVVTQPDKPKGRGKKLAFPPVKEKALAWGIPVYQPLKVREESFLQVLHALAPEVIVVAAFGQILPESILNLPPCGCINVHASLLPKYRGAAPIQRAIIEGERETGVTTMYMAKGLDTGDMLDRTVVEIDRKETGESLHDKLALAGSTLILETLRKLEAGEAVRIPQDDAESSYAGMLKKEQGKIDWQAGAVQIERLIRGLTPWPSAYTPFHKKILKIWAADAEEGDTGLLPGTVAATDKKSFTVQTGEGLLRIREVQLTGKKRMPVSAFLLGNPLEQGMRLTDTDSQK